MKQFEYKVIENSIGQQILDDLGRDGWELRTTFAMVKENKLLTPPVQVVNAFVFIREKEKVE